MSRRNRDDDELPMSGVRPVDEDVRRELEFHLERREAELIAQGYTAERARAAARDLFGDRRMVEDACREIEGRRRQTGRRARRWEAVRQDLVVGMRMLRRTPGFAAAALATLALGIGATSAVFTIVNQVLLRPLPYPQPEQIVDVVEVHEGNGWGRLPWANFLDIQSSARSFAAIASYGNGTTTVLGADSPMRARAASVSRDFFKVMGVTPFLGRLPLPEEHARGMTPVAVVSYGFWRDHLGAPTSLTDVRLRLDAEHDVVGVLPPGFGFPEGTEIWRPLEVSSDQGMSRTSHNWSVIGRLASASTVESATKEVDAILARLKDEYYPDFDAVGSRITLLSELTTRNARTPLYLLMGAAALVLLTACSNLAGGMLARGTARAGELAVRSALGATRTRILRQLLTESTVLALGGGALGLFLGWFLLKTFGSLAPGTVPVGELAIDFRVAGFAVLVVILSVVLFGLVPAVRISNDEQTSNMLRQGGRGTADRGRLRIWNVLVAGEVALAVTLIVGSTLLIRSFGNVMSTDLGFDPEKIVTAEVELPSFSYPGEARAIAAFHMRAIEAIAGVPGVSAVGFANVAPLGGNNMSGALEVEGKPLDPRGQFNSFALYRVVGGDFFSATGIPLIRGRLFESTDDESAPGAVIINQAFADAEFPGQDPLGKRLRVAGMDGPQYDTWYQIVGVVGNSRSGSVIDRFRPTWYFDHRQRPSYRSRWTTYLVRSELSSEAGASALRKGIASVDPSLPLEIKTMNVVLSDSVSDRRFTMMVLSAFAGVALFLAIVGIFSVVSYSVAQRTREIGVRIALGSSPGRVRQMVVFGAMRAVAPGLALGVLLAVASAGAIRSLLYGVSALDPLALVLAVVALAMAAVLSSLLPAIRCTRADPMLAIRGD